MAFWNLFSGKDKSPQDLLAAGNLKGALKGFLQVLEQKKAPDPITMMQVANLYLKLKKPKEAKEYFIKVGEHYGETGFLNKSVVAFKKALNIDPDDASILHKLAEYNDKVPKFMTDKRFADVDSDDLAPGPASADNETTDDQIQEISFFEDEGEGDDLPGVSFDDDAEVETANHAFDQQVSSDLPDVSFDEDDSLPDINTSFADLDADDEPQTTANQVETVEEEIMEIPVDEPANEAQTDNGTAVRETEKIIFRTQQNAGKAEAPETEDGDLGFDSLDDALDTLFTDGGGQEGGGLGIFDHAGNDEAISQEEEAASPFADLEAEAENDEEDEEISEINFVDEDDDDEFGSEPQEVNWLSDEHKEQNSRHWPLFRTMPRDVFMKFVIALEHRDYEPESYIVRQGDPGDEMYLIADGQVAVEVFIDGNPTQVASLGAGDFFGEASLLSGEPRNASVKALSTVNCLILKRAHLDELSTENPEVMETIRSIYYTRMQQNASRES